MCHLYHRPRFPDPHGPHDTTRSPISASKRQRAERAAAGTYGGGLYGESPTVGRTSTANMSIATAAFVSLEMSDDEADENAAPTDRATSLFNQSLSSVDVAIDGNRPILPFSYGVYRNRYAPAR